MGEKTDTEYVESRGGTMPRGASAIQLTLLVVLRLVVGWHFLYEGVAKLLTPGWSSANFLTMSRWVLSDWFHRIASDPGLLRVVDLLNICGLIAIGLGLILGCFTRLACLGGVAMLALYYIAHPPLVGLGFGAPAEGHYLIVNKNLVELVALCVLLMFPTGKVVGLDRFIARLWAKWRAARRRKKGEEIAEVRLLDRRTVIGSLATLPVLGGFAVALVQKYRWESHEEKHLKQRVDAVTRATIKTFDFAGLKDLKGQVSTAKIKGVDFSRLILGGNLIGGWAHARDLIYVSKLVKAYHDKTKIFETFLLAEKCGINAILTNPVLCGVINEYWKRDIGKIQFISDCAGKNFMDLIRLSIGQGACACYVQGGVADQLVQTGEIDQIAKAVELIRASSLPAGIGAHHIITVKTCVEKGILPDFWMKTLHEKNYWSAKHPQQHDNIFCLNPEETVAFMKTLEQPWIAFKVLGAGAIHPKAGFDYAFKNGADFICVGMYDFQIVEDVNIALEVLPRYAKRERPWRA
ncbi:MAG: DoxX family membrane protein [Planctomycetota bacterium]